MMKVIAIFFAALIITAVGVAAFQRLWLLNSGEKTTTPIKEGGTLGTEAELQSLLGWIPYWDKEAAFQTLRENVELFNFISLFWYYLDRNAAILPYKTAGDVKDIIEFAHKNNIKVLAVIANLPDYAEGGDWDQTRVNRVIRSSDARKAHIASILNIILTGNFDGVNIDYEALDAVDRENFSHFIEELAAALHAEGKLLGVAIHPKTSEANPAEDNGSRAQDWSELARHADQLYLMTYSEHSKESWPGPNASPDWVESVLQYAVNEIQIPRSKLYFGIPLYGHAWQKTGSDFIGTDNDVTFEKALSLIQSRGTVLNRDEKSSTPFSSYKDNGGREFIMWFEDATSTAVKLKLRDKFALPNVALWRLGGEDPAIWSLFENLKQSP